MFGMILCINIYMGDPVRLGDVTGVVVIAARATLAFTPNLWSERTLFPSSSLIAITKRAPQLLSRFQLNWTELTHLRSYHDCVNHF
jgi:hypothetical protein